ADHVEDCSTDRCQFWGLQSCGSNRRCLFEVGFSLDQPVGNRCTPNRQRYPRMEPELCQSDQFRKEPVMVLKRTVRAGRRSCCGRAALTLGLAFHPSSLTQKSGFSSEATNH